MAEWALTAKLKAYEFALVFQERDDAPEAIIFVYSREGEVEVLKNPNRQLLARLQDYVALIKGANGAGPTSLVVRYRDGGAFLASAGYDAGGYMAGVSLYKIRDKTLMAIAKELNPSRP